MITLCLAVNVYDYAGYGFGVHDENGNKTV